MNGSESIKSDNPAPGVDAQIKARQRKNAGLYIASTLATLIFIAVFLSWLLLIKGYALVVGPDEVSKSARVTVNDGHAVAVGQRLYTLGGNVRIEVGAPTFETSVVSLDGNSPTTIEVVLRPSPGKLQGVVNVAGDETAWRIDGRLAHLGASVEQEVTPGVHRIAVDNRFYVPWSQELTFERGELNRLEVALSPVAGEIIIDTVPSGAAIYIADKLVGPSPQTVPVEGGQYPIRIEKAGYQHLDDVIAVVNSDPRPSRRYRLELLKGTLSIGADPAGGVLLVDGSETVAGQVAVDANTLHRIRYHKPGFYPYTTTIVVRPGEEKQLDITLRPEMGKVTLTSQVTASVLLNGKLLGPTPQTLALPALPHQVEFQRTGYRSVTKTVVPSARQPVRVEVDLMSEFDARRAEGRPLFVASLGIDMAKFRPTDFTLGSADNEPGRKRHEHRVPVSFSRGLWVSRHEITQAQYRAFDPGRADSALPVTDVTWLDAARYCNWLSEQEGLSPFYRIRGDQLLAVNDKARGYRLPTEAEWEWLARRAQRAQNTTYVWGNTDKVPDGAGNFADQSISGSQPFILTGYRDGFAGKAPVGSFDADRAGLFDLSGNVSEWVHDRYSYTPPDTTITHRDYLGAAKGLAHVVKGANYQSGRLKALRGAARVVGEGAKPTVGFRIARYH